MSDLLLSSILTNVTLEAGYIPSQWLISGEPQTKSKLLGKSPDGLGYIMLWECGVASYKWHYTEDEAYIVLSGEGFMTDSRGVEHHYGPGDLAFFPAGTDSTWRHPSHFRKIAVLKAPVSRPMALLLKAWNRFSRMMGRG